jgi:REP element-mobilizing transposase RayT
MPVTPRRVARTGSPLYRRLATGEFRIAAAAATRQSCAMEIPERNPGLERVQHELRAHGVRHTNNKLRSGIHSRGYLPHVKREGASYFVTIRLGDSLPQEVLLRFKQEQAERLRKLTTSDTDGREEANHELHRQIERYLDRSVGECHLRRADIAAMAADALRYFHGKQYLLDDWVVMPNHIHLILWPISNFTLSEIMRSRKRHMARQANVLLGRTGQRFWQPEPFDHWIRNDKEKERIRRYIRNNPVKAGLCARPEEWQWGSAWAGWAAAD